MRAVQPRDRIRNLERALLDHVLPEVAEVFDQRAVATTDERDAVRSRDAGDTRDAESLVLIGAETDGKEFVLEVGPSGARFVDQVAGEEMRFSEPHCVALVVRCAGAEAGLISGDAS